MRDQEGSRVGDDARPTSGLREVRAAADSTAKYGRSVRNRVRNDCVVREAREVQGS